MRQTICSSCGGLFPAGQSYCRHCGQPVLSALVGLEPGQDEFEAIEESEEIRLDQLAKFDYILIRTHNNQYRFTLLEPGRGYGLLSGGALGDHQVKAILLGAFGSDSAELVQNFTMLRTGLSAVFHLDVARGNKRMGTSPITGLTLIRGGKTTRSRPGLSNERSRRLPAAATAK